MGSSRAFVVLVAALALSVSRAAAENPLSPLLSPVLKGLCDAVWCGKGSCEVSLNHTFGFFCECSPGWSQFHIDDHFRFLPCIIPNCSLKYSCDKEPAPAPAPMPQPPSNPSFFDPCEWSYCGGGSCVKESSYEHRCDCKEGYSNLLNHTGFPCFRNCSIGADCANLGITLSNSTASTTRNSSDRGIASPAPKSSLWWFILPALTMLLAM